MKNRKLFVYMRDYILLLFVVVCLVTAGLMIGDMVIHVVKPFVNPSAYPVTEDTGVLTERQLDVFHGILDAEDAGTETVSIPPMTGEEQREIATHMGLYYGSMDGVSGLVTWGEDTAILNLDLFRQFVEQKIVIDARINYLKGLGYEF